MNSIFARRLLLSMITLMAVNSAHAATITAWNFNNLATGGNTSPSASTGSGIATTVGMNNSFAGNTASTISTDASDIELGVASSNDWRIRGGNSTNTNINGWYATAPQYSEGAQFSVSTLGYSNIIFSYDWNATTKGVRDLQAQYTTNGTTWQNVGPLQVANTSATSYQTGLTINFAALGITSVNNNASFAVRLVAAYDPTYTLSNAYTQAGTPTAVMSNTAGNWRFDNIVISGTVAAVPEPEIYGMLLAGISLIGFMSRRRKSA